MSQGREEGARAPEVTKDVLTELAREGARRLLEEALRAEVAEYVDAAREERDGRGHRLVVRNGHARERRIQTGVGPIPVRAPRVNDRRTDASGNRRRFTSAILPPYLRRTQAVEDLIPWLYLYGVSTNGFKDALESLLGSGAPGLSPKSVERLKSVWEAEYAAWNTRPLSGRRYVYLWVDGIYVNVRLTGERACILVVIGATAEGDKELLAVHDGVRESEESWKDVLLDLRDRGLEAPHVATGDGALGFWKAVPKVYPTTRWQRCWVHKTANILNKLPRKLQPEAKRRLHEIWGAPDRAEAEEALGSFAELFGAKYPKAVTCLEKDRDVLLTFYDFPAEHWKHLRTTNPIESTFATVRLRTNRTKGPGSRTACLTMVFKLCQVAARSWRRLDAANRLAELIDGVAFKDGIRVAA